MSDDVFENLRLELRRGALTLAVLTQLQVEQYGYTLRKALSDEAREIEESPMKTLLRRLESQGLLASEWREENKRSKRFYHLSPEGVVVLKQLLAEWQVINASITRMLAEG